MKASIGLAALLVLSGCSDVGRYQFIASSEVNALWRLDTKSGQIAKCLYTKTSVTCSQPLSGS